MIINLKVLFRVDRIVKTAIVTRISKRTIARIALTAFIDVTAFLYS
jgi:hypothetical protein